MALPTLPAASIAHAVIVTTSSVSRLATVTLSACTGVDADVTVTVPLVLPRRLPVTVYHHWAQPRGSLDGDTVPHVNVTVTVDAAEYELFLGAPMSVTTGRMLSMVKDTVQLENTSPTTPAGARRSRRATASAQGTAAVPPPSLAPSPSPTTYHHWYEPLCRSTSDDDTSMPLMEALATDSRPRSDNSVFTVTATLPPMPIRDGDVDAGSAAVVARAATMTGTSYTTSGAGCRCVSRVAGTMPRNSGRTLPLTATGTLALTALRTNMTVASYSATASGTPKVTS